MLRFGYLHAQSFDQVDQHQIHSNPLVDPKVSTMIARQEEFNARVNFLMSAKMRNLHYIQYHGLRHLLNPWLGDYLRLLPSGLRQISMGCEHGVVLSISKVKIIVLQ
jgi:hypothetical protein